MRRHADQGRTVFLLGHNDHEEVVGTVGEAADRVVVINGMDEARTVTVPDQSRVAYAVQTTLAVDEAEQVAQELRKRFPAIVAPPTDDICYATTNRQKAVREVAADADLVIVVGSPNSSNSARLVEVAERAGRAGGAGRRRLRTRPGSAAGRSSHRRDCWSVGAAGSGRRARALPFRPRAHQGS